MSHDAACEQALEQRAVLHLLNLLTRERSHKFRRHSVGVTEADPDVDRPRRLASYRSGVETFRTLGAISPAQAATWQRRFESAANAPAADTGDPDADTRVRVDGFLGELFSEGQRQRHASPEYRVRSFSRSVWSLQAVGAIGKDEAQRWVDRMHLEHGVPTREEKEQGERTRTCLALDLRRVIAAPVVVGGLRISHLELYADGALLYSLETARDSAWCGADPRYVASFSDQRDSPLEVADDVGTVYEPRPYHEFAKSLTPAVPDDASRLEVSYAGAAAEIALR